MNGHDKEQTVKDLVALSAHAGGSHVAANQPDADHAAKVAELKAKYQAGQLVVDAGAVASKIVDSHLGKEPV